MKKIEKRQEKIVSVYDSLVLQNKELEKKLLVLERKFDRQSKDVFDMLQKISNKG